MFRNSTCYPDDEVQRLVRLAMAELELPSPNSILIRVSHTRLSEQRRRAGNRYVYGATGRAHPYVFVRPDVPKGAAWEIHLRIGKPDDFPCAWYDRGYAGVEVGMLRDWRDALVALAAHEGKHIEVYQHELAAHGRTSKAKRRAAGFSGHAEEGRCDAEAASALRRFKEAT